MKCDKGLTLTSTSVLYFQKLQKIHFVVDKFTFTYNLHVQSRTYVLSHLHVFLIELNSVADARNYLYLHLVYFIVESFTCV